MNYMDCAPCMLVPLFLCFLNLDLRNDRDRARLGPNSGQHDWAGWRPAQSSCQSSADFHAAGEQCVRPAPAPPLLLVYCEWVGWPAHSSQGGRAGSEPNTGWSICVDANPWQRCLGRYSWDAAVNTVQGSVSGKVTAAGWYPMSVHHLLVDVEAFVDWRGWRTDA
jgi:hypothetical protein